ncbi:MULTISPECIES: response regulator transcription factor [unclassified Paenibacillus]|uniref:response regulator transcription factor n=1 Tax=unclassified Paenibacillus TaxID=185978 RepID=UPI001AE4CFEF|nr:MULTISPECIES: response regulator transcription factor [unclassified Paenibacillus]MBP1156476.1 two-component system response regulator ResD [Paenibacillus sp. PvP091]MBP1168138.1 two-component system response regulator ResD [Paenibacillus sp. PvR098]MBP2439166.1 two-component system response regulator ResD [Paenibacillus sp. PvP052]
MSKVLIVDDDWKMRELIRLHLTKHGFEMSDARNANEALNLVKEQSFHAIILDIMLPDMDGWEVCRKIREVFKVPILMLTARSETKDKVYGLTLGADDYLVKPFEPEELIARLNALIRRAGYEETTGFSEKVAFGQVVIVPESRQVLVRGKETADFAPKEFDLLLYLARHPRRVFDRELLLDQVWGQDFIGDIRTVDTHVKNIRDKLKRAGISPSPIETIWGVGYRFRGLEAT